MFFLLYGVKSRGSRDCRTNSADDSLSEFGLDIMRAKCQISGTSW